MTERDRPWLMRTYSGHSTAEASNELYRTNLGKGQTGLSVAFDLPTQTGYDADHPLAAGEVGKVGVPVNHLGHMRTLFDEIPVGEMNTSMTINATAAWLLGLYVAHAEERGVDPSVLRGTTQNDIVKEYLSRGTHIFPPEASRRLIVDMIAFCSQQVPKWNPINICSYHLQEAGATPVQELAFSLATAIDILDAVRDSGQVSEERFPAVVGSVSFFVNAGIRFVEETCKMRAFTELWDRITRDRYGVEDPKLRRFRYGVQVNSLGLTESQPENNVQRIVLEMLGVTLSKKARARSIQLPAWNEALGLPRPWDQQWSLRMQQVLAFESDLLEYDDLFDGSHVVEARTAELIDAALVEMADIEQMGGAFEAIGELKRRLVASHTERRRDIESGDLTIVGVNDYTETERSPLGHSEQILKVDPDVEPRLAAAVAEWRADRDHDAVAAALADLAAAAEGTTNIMIPTITAAKAGVTTGEWAETLREVYGQYRAPTGVDEVSIPSPELTAVADDNSSLPGGPPRLLIAKPGLDGHSNGAEQVAVAARDAGMSVSYDGIRVTPDEIAAAAAAHDAELVAVSILSGAHMELVPQVRTALLAAGVEAPLVVGGIIPDDDQRHLTEMGVVRIYTPKDYELAAIVRDMSELVASRR